ncbi:MAG: lipocalin family protein [Bacteroidales bacterium]|nr:lipocalin family protein [Bacteroidales bacterium]
MKKIMSLLIASILGLASCSCSGQKVDNSTVGSLDLYKYLGTWYEIARFDHSFERGLTYAKATYSVNTDGTINVRNSGMKNGKYKVSKGKAKLTDTVGLLRVSFFGPFYSDYRVMMLSDDYNYALVGSGNAKYLWILSRTPKVADDILTQILSTATSRGYDTSKLIWVEQ